MLLFDKWTLYLGRLLSFADNILLGVHKYGVIWWNYTYERGYKQQKATTCTLQYMFALASQWVFIIYVLLNLRIIITQIKNPLHWYRPSLQGCLSDSSCVWQVLVAPSTYNFVTKWGFFSHWIFLLEALACRCSLEEGGSAQTREFVHLQLIFISWCNFLLFTSSSSSLFHPTYCGFCQSSFLSIWVSCQITVTSR